MPIIFKWNLDCGSWGTSTPEVSILFIFLKASLILITSDVLVLCLEACMYDFWVSLVTLTSLIFLKYLEIWLTSFCNLVGIGEGIFLILTGIGLPMDLLLLLDTGSTLRVNFNEIFCLRVLEFLLEMRESHLD